MKDKEFGALKDINLQFNDGEFVAVLGESGSGKSTLLNMISGIDEYTDGEIIIDSVNTKKFNDSKWREFRNKNIGFIFQRYNLIEHLSATDNIILPLLFAGEKKSKYEKLAKNILTKIGLASHANTPASKLSGGEKQRLAIARSILMDPHILLCDEPTGALDSASAEIIMSLIKEFSKNRIVVLVTHDEKIAYDYADRIIRIHEGEIISDEYIQKVTETEQVSKVKAGHEHADYKKVNRDFINFVAKANFKQNIAVNFKIVLSFMIGLTILFMINLILSNVIIHNQLMFERNNDYKKYSVEGYHDSTLSQLSKNEFVSEAGIEKSYLIEDSSLIYKSKEYSSKYIAGANKVNNPVIKTMPNNFENFYLKDHLIEYNKNYKKVEHGVFVTSELIYNHYLNVSLVKDKDVKIKDLVKQYPLKSFIGEKIKICGDSSNETCFTVEITGIIDSNYNGVNYSDTMFISQKGFDLLLDYLTNDIDIINVNRLYQTNMYFYLKDFNHGKFDVKDLEADLEVNVVNSHVETYKQVMMLENIGNYILLAIIITLFIIFSTVVINIIGFNIASRTKDIGVYTSIGVSRISIRRIFVRETIKVVQILVILLAIVYAILSVLFSLVYTRIISYNANLFSELGRIRNISYQIDLFIYIIIATSILYLISVYIPAYKVSMKKAIDTLTW